MTIYPLLMAPYFRFGSETPWGGDMLRDAFMKDAPEQTGESLEVSALEGMESIVNNGVRAATNLRRLASIWGSALTGEGCEGIGLQMSLIDAREAMPVHAHGEKSEAWVILNCESDSEIVYGTQRVRVRPGDIFYIPSGLAHAVGAGIQLLKVQPNDDGSDVCEPTVDQKGGKIYGTTVLCKGGSRTYYAADRHFELSRLNVAGRMPIADGRMLMLMPFAPCRLTWAEESMELAPFESVVIPAALSDVCIESDDSKVMACATPDLASLREVLGYRAGNVAGLTEQG